MPRRKQPATLFAIALPVTALCIRNQCDAILHNYGDVTQSAFKDRIESFNEHLRKEVPIRVLDCIRQHHNLSVFIYHQVKTLKVQGKTLRNTPIHQHLIHNVCPQLNRVTFLDLSEVEGTLDLFRAISNNCRELQSIFINTYMGYPANDNEVGMRLMILTTCKKLTRIRNLTFSGGFHCVVFRILQELPELREFKCDATSILAKKEMLVEVYNISQLAIQPQVSAKNIQWLNSHCPFINYVELLSVDDTVLQALALTDWKIKFVEFNGKSHKFNETMKLFFKNKGMFIDYVFRDCNQVSLSYENLVWISQCCPVLRRLSITCNEEQLTALQRRSTRLFPNLEYLSMAVHSSPIAVQYSIFQVILDALKNLRSLQCIVRESATLPFLNIIAGLRNPFTDLIKVRINVISYNPDETSKFVQGFVPIAMGWKNIRHIEVDCHVDLLPEAVQYLEEIKSTIKKRNLDVTLNVGRLSRH